MANPYEVLEVDQNAPMQAIVPAMTKAMQRRKYTMQEITAARAQLSTPAKRLEADFTFPIIDAEPVSTLQVPDIKDMDINSLDPDKDNTL